MQMVKVLHFHSVVFGQNEEAPRRSVRGTANTERVERGLPIPSKIFRMLHAGVS